MNKFLHTSVGSCLTRRILMSAAFVVLTLGASAQTLTHRTARFRAGSMEQNPIGSYSQQPAHEDRVIIYATENQSINLARKTEAFKCYVRWYDYATDKAMSNLTTRNAGFSSNETASQSNANYGAIKYSNGTSNLVTGFNATYVYPGGEVKYVGCDQSAYVDYTTGTNFTEPSLSMRSVYEIHPASEMAEKVDATTGDDAWLEVHSMVAPTGTTIYIGPDYAYYETSNKGYYANYYYNKNNPTSLAGNTWKWNRSVTTNNTMTDGTVISGQFIAVSSTRAQTVTYTLTKTVSNKTYHIAKITVEYKNKSEVGPTVLADPSYLTGTDVLASEDFNFGVTSLSGDKQHYSIPLEADESSFGFMYGSKKYDGNTPYYGGMSGNSDAGTASTNEYCFVNSGHAWSGRTCNALANHVYSTATPAGYDKTKGYAIYADGSQIAGTIFSIKFDANLCPGAIMYFSAWIGSANNSGTEPNLDFVVLGIKNGKETKLTTFSTRISNSDAQSWKRILFPLVFNTDIKFTEYRLKVVNKAADTNSNDFFLDDVKIYLKPAPLQPIEASSANECLSDNSPLTLYTRIDYAQSNEVTSGTTPLYYRWLDYQGNTIVTDLYYGATNSNQNGYIDVDQRYRSEDGMPADKIVANFAAFDNAYRTTPTPVAKYIYETGLTPLSNGNTDRYVLYIATPITIKLGDMYTCIIAKSEGDLGATATCSNSADITVSNGMRINSVAGGGMVKGLRKQICANYSYDLTVVMEYAVLEGNTTHTDRSAYVAHWLFGLADEVDADFAANGKDGLYGADFSTIQKAVEAYKTDTITAVQTALLNRLVQKGLLTLCKYDAAGKPVASDTTYFVMPLNDEDHLSYTAFPVVKVKSNAPDCATPQSITLFFPTGANRPDKNVVSFVKRYKETVPTFVNSRPRRVRIIEGTTEMQVKAELTNPGREYAFGAVSLHSTDDATYTSASAVPTITPKSPFTGDNLYVTFGGLGNLKAGHSYTFKVLYNLANPTDEDIASACLDDKNAALHDGEAYITFLIVPKTLTYTGAGNNAAWNDDYNWSLVNGTDTTVTFVPLAETNVIFQSGDHIIADSITVNTSVEAKKRLQEAAVEKAALPYITYDINYEPYTCNNVYVPAATALPGQTNIDVKGTWTFEMPVTPNKWVMSAMPVQGIVSGDIFIPASGEESQEDYFAVKEMSQTSGNYAADRITYSFYNSMFNQSVINKDVNTTYDITSSTWSFATNALTTAFPAGFGWSLGFDNAAEGKSIRLPKKDTEYHYFRNDTWLGMSETITRDANYGKAAFTGDEMTLELKQNADGKVFLLGNPTFAYIDLMALKNANSNITGVFYLSGLDNGSRYDHVTGQALADDWYTTDGQAPRYLAPMHAVLVVKNGDAAKELKIKITKSMLVTSNGSKDGAIITGAPRRAAALSAEKAIYIKAETGSFSSTALLLEDADASNAFFQDEDAEVFLLDQAKTPFAVYTVADSKALAINRISDLDVVPLGFYAQKNVSSEKIVFTGADAYLSEWDLVDNSTGNREALSDGFTTTLSMSNNGVIRYYLEHARKTAPAGSDVTGGELTFSTYTQDGMLTVFAADDMIDFRLYDAAGRLLAADKNAGRQQDFCLPKGVYVVRANGKAAKVIVK